MKYFFLLLPLFFLISCTEQVTPPDFLIFEAPYGFSTHFFLARTTARALQSESGGVVVNGSYFGLTERGLSYPAGLWIERGVQKYPLRTDDPNLSYGVFSSGNQIQIVQNADTKPLIDSCLMMTGCSAFQAGPLVLSGNILQDFGESWHAYGKHERTLLGKTNSGKIFFFIFPMKITLKDASEKILATHQFDTDRLTLLNLDGGPSTAYFDGKNGLLPDEKLPIFFHIPKKDKK